MSMFDCPRCGLQNPQHPPSCPMQGKTIVMPGIWPCFEPDHQDNTRLDALKACIRDLEACIRDLEARVRALEVSRIVITDGVR